MINLFVSYYQDKNSVRQQELDSCFEKNLHNKQIDKMYVVVDGQIKKIETSARDTVIGSSKRYTYKDYFDLINSVTGDDDVNILCNSDIYFEDLSLFNTIKKDECYVLSRWDVGADGTIKLFNRPDSQDCWVFRGKVKEVGGCDFSTGFAGCDNATAYCLEQSGYKILNPSKDIKTFHLHNSGIRHYDATVKSKDRVPPPYKQIWPHHLAPTEPINENWISSIANLKTTGLQSQYEEEAIIEYIFKNIGVKNKFFVDLGAGAYNGTMSNTRKLRQSGWDGFGVDMADTKDVWVMKEFVTPENICSILEGQVTPKDFDFLNLDIDSNDFYVLGEILKMYSPRLICSEFNGTLKPNESLVLAYEDGYTWDRTNKYGYSFLAGKKLLAQYGYTIIYNQHDTNIFAIKKEFINGTVFPEVTARQNIYHPVNNKAKWVTY